MATSENHLVVCRMGHMPYRPAWDLQARLQQRLIEAKRADPPEKNVPHVMLFVEHPPVYTLGKSGDDAHLLVDERRLEAQGASFVRIDRGGDITYHGPGQLVGYPILDMDRIYRDIHRYLRDLEEVVIRVCAGYGIKTGRVEGKTGVWIGPDPSGPARKICAMGVRLSRWVTMHGFAFNINTDLRRYDAIVPCGIRDSQVTSLARELGGDVDERKVQDRVVEKFSEIFKLASSVHDEAEAQTFIEAYLGRKDASPDEQISTRPQSA